MRFAVLGRLQVDVGGRPVPLGAFKRRLVLAMLLVGANRPVSLDLLTEVVWQGEPPRTARKNLQVHVSALRKLLGDDGGEDERSRIVHDCGGYRLRVERAELDVLRFHDLARAGRAATTAGEPGTAARLLRQALDLWRGDPFADLHGAPLIRAEAERLEERCLGSYEDWAEAELEPGGTPAAVAETVADLVERHPLRERLQAARMKALHLMGRQAEALAGYDAYRQRMARELGLAPSPALEAHYRAILAAGRLRPTTTAAADRTVLPPDTPDFTGRTHEVRELTRLLGHGGNGSQGGHGGDGSHGGRVAVLTGPTGIGKTTLAVRVAHLLRSHFPDGRVLTRPRTADGSPWPWETAIAELVRLAGLPGPPADDPRQNLARWHAWLGRRRVLLILDDVPDEALARVLLPAEGGSAALVTSRTHLAGLAPVHRIELPPYTPAEALDLLGRIIGPEPARRDPRAAQELVAACGHLPLAVRAGGLKLAALRHLTLREFADRLADPAAVLDELAAGDITVRAALALGWRDLPPTGRTAVRRLARHPLGRPFGLREAARLLGCQAPTALRQLEALIGAGLITSPRPETPGETPLYHLPRLLHLYAREHPAPARARAARPARRTPPVTEASTPAAWALN
ncbi:AfsR/SARP family transcriptional regulator [Kitasatospora paracochleata]|uniref:DNA-binding SARP family transcriptional activator/energy-coupling factor transporter ATP-binding protein EcfA2 n=2 Tax=Kitasatospora paracochleata TaxID=58354 RepID=A0ABT1JAA2_9ACTN|nr:BTAD domain-containing putative transcriptional regulator [Kitasatospora paracochleata]MCP2314390.1 DNA-binding SARP family transcriptional activator/energy-coupling factor transporter ATP-binding protein EcfA2 [Kitasatospora paracochleata]